MTASPFDCRGNWNDATTKALLIAFGSTFQRCSNAAQERHHRKGNHSMIFDKEEGKCSSRDCYSSSPVDPSRIFMRGACEKL
mmetsp:Transcript_29844/g.81965  ORF Transcript_29844/g.81965 Transcript_29844/m.81965 type:complete len:82 (+) Transcript_29844:3810-4055(+)